jgi:hypothetical protein
MLNALTQVAAKIEVTEGTAIALAGADAFLAMNPSFKPSINVEGRDNLTSSLSRFAGVPGLRSAVMEFDVELKGSGTAGTAPALGKLLKACGFGETVSAGTSVTYKPASSSISSITLGMYADGIHYQMWGCRGDVSLKLEAGKPGMLHFVFTGADFSVTTLAMLSSGVAYESTLPIPFQTATMTIDSYAALIGTMEFRLGNTVTLRPSVNASSGNFSAVITKRNPTLSIDPEEVIIATYDFFGKWRSGALGALTLALTGAAGNICTITAPKVQYTSITPADRGGQKSLGIDCLLSRNAGDDELSIVFT